MQNQFARSWSKGFPEWFWDRIREESKSTFNIAGMVGMAGVSLAILADLANVPPPLRGYAVALRIIGIAYFAALTALVHFAPDKARRHYDVLVLGIWLSVVVPPLIISAWLPPDNFYFIALLEAEFAIFAFLQTRARIWIPALFASNSAYIAVAVYYSGLTPQESFFVSLVVSFAIVGLIGGAAQHVILKTKLALHESLARETDRGDSLAKQVVERTAAAEKQARLAAVGRLAAGISHDFNNLLQAIHAAADLTTRTAGVVTEAKDNLRFIVASTERGAQLVRKILDFSAGISKKPSGPLDLNDFFNDVVPFLRRAFPEPLEIRWHATDAPVWVMIESTQLEQIVLNLATNANDAMPQGGALTIALQASDRDARISIADSGTGMDSLTLQHIFEPFFTTKAENGTGLGLAQVYGLVKNAGGWIEVDSEIRKGTRFRLYLPLAPAPVPSGAVEPAGGGVEVHLPPGRVLIVEDESDLRELFRQMVMVFGMEPILAANGADAIRVMMSGEKVDIILTDQSMPDTTGVELAEELQRLGIGIPRVLMTGLLGQELVGTRLFAAILHKPFGLLELRSTLHAVLKTSK